jgi:hypothetical protein
MRLRKMALALGLAALAFGAVEGCGGEPAGEAELAKLPPPSSGSTDRAQLQPPPKAKPKFGSPPKSQMVPPTDHSP